MAKRSKHALLWRIIPPAGGPVSYVFGTMHVRDERAFAWLEKALIHLQSCDYFATEYDFSETDMTSYDSVMKLPEGQTLQTLLPRGAWNRLQFQAQQKLNMPAELLNHHHPMMVSTMLTTSLLTEEREQTLDETLWQQAVSLGKNIIGVESFADQVGFVKQIPLKTHVKGLVSYLKNPEKEKRQLKKMFRLYVKGDIQSLYKSAKKNLKGKRNVLLNPRNQRMALRIGAVAKERSLFCAIGAAHLAGEKGVLRLLKKAGFKVKALPL
ncbi:MAG: TraB/GumN family protein [Saprospiraceae bacterium]|nr:TraB/GumN family protein [Saprospiraceae bacterium]